MKQNKIFKELTSKTRRRKKRFGLSSQESKEVKSRMYIGRMSSDIQVKNWSSMKIV